MAVQDNFDYLLYKSKGGTLSFDEWMKAGKPAPGGPGTPATSAPPTSPYVSGSTTPLAPPLPPPPRPEYTGPPPPGYTSPQTYPFEDNIDQDIQDIEDYGAYTSKGGQKSFEAWVSAGRPPSDNQTPTGGADVKTYHDDEGNTWYYDNFGQKIDTGYDPQFDIRAKKTTTDPSLSDPRNMPKDPPPSGFHWEWDGTQWQPIKDKAGEPRPKKSRQIGAPDKYWDAYGREWTWDDYEGYQETGYDKTKDTRLTEKDKGIPQPPGEVPTDKYGRKATWDADDGEWRFPPNWDVDPEGEAKAAAAKAAKDAEDKRKYEAEQKQIAEETAFRQQQAQQASDQFWKQFDYQKSQDAARMQAEKESRLANLRASPASWLQYSLEANQTPVIQPWQKPLMPQQYGNLNVGQPIPGWAGLNQGSSNLPELTTPSTQYFARIGPTAQQQWGGYQQMQSGAPMDESLFRLQSQSAPGGRNQGLSWLR